MLSAPIQSSSNASQVNSTANPLVPAVAVNSTTTTADANGLLEKNAGSGSQAQFFAGQLDEALANVELVGTEVVNVESNNVESLGAESIATEAYGEQAVLQNLEQSGFEQQEQKNQQQPNAEAWLQAMLDQQQLQLQARDTAAVATPSVFAAVASSVNSVNSIAVVSLNSTVVADKTTTTIPAASNAVTLVPGTAFNQQTINAAGNSKTPASEKIFDSVANTTTNPTAMVTTAHAGSASDARVIDSANTTIASTSMAMSSSAASVVQLAAAVTNEVGASETISSSIVPAALTSAVAESPQRTVQSQLNLHAPEAKWGEQLLHALRDNVQVQIQQKIQNATIRLDPPELGSLEIYLSHESGRLQVQITASQADVARLIQHTSDRLRQELSGPQFTQVNIQTSAEGQSGQQHSRERQRFNGDELILANEQVFAGDEQQSKRPGDVLVTV